MTEGRIFFAGNPWPEGHPIKHFRWSAERRGEQIWFGFHLETADYDAEREIDDDGSAELPSDWDHPGVWGNYHSCIVSSDYWHRGGFSACDAADFCAEYLDGRSYHIDSLPADLCDGREKLAFHIYLLGHDSVADHRIQFSRVGATNAFDITWQGRIALSYVGDDEPKYSFRAELIGVPLPVVAGGA